MSKILRSIVGLTLALILGLSFQNCAPGIENQADDLESQKILDERRDHKDRDHGLETKAKAKIETSSEDLLSDRRLTSAILENIFGPRYAAQGVGVRGNLTIFGNNCSLHEEFRVLNTSGSLVRADATRICAVADTPQFLNAPVFPKSSVLRSQNLNNTCYGLATDSAALSFAVAQIGSGVPQGNAANVLKAFRMFYRHKPAPHPALIQSLQVMLPGQISRVADWAPIFYTICISSGWQIL